MRRTGDEYFARGVNRRQLTLRNNLLSFLCREQCAALFQPENFASDEFEFVRYLRSHGDAGQEDDNRDFHIF